MAVGMECYVLDWITCSLMDPEMTSYSLPLVLRWAKKEWRFINGASVVGSKHSICPLQNHSYKYFLWVVEVKRLKSICILESRTGFHRWDIVMITQ